jgi:cytochrome c5
MASKRHIRRKACGNKVRYDKKSAKQAAYFAKRRTGDFIVAYHCQYCGGYHIGHVPQVVNRFLALGV